MHHLSGYKDSVRGDLHYRSDGLEALLETGS